MTKCLFPYLLLLLRPRRGSPLARPPGNPTRLDVSPGGIRFPLSLRERAGVRENRTDGDAWPLTNPGTVELGEFCGRTRGFQTGL